MPFVYVVALVGALGGMLFGFDTGAVSGAILYLKRQFVLSPELQELVTSIALVGQSLSYLFCRHNGRKLGFQFELVEHRKAANVRADCCPEFSERSKELGLLIDEALLASDES